MTYITLYLMRTWIKWTWMDLESRKQKGRIPGNWQSMEGYILTYSMAKKWNLWELSFFSREMDWWIKNNNNNKKQLQNWHMFTDNTYQLRSYYHHLHAESDSNHSAFHQSAYRHMAVRLKASACVKRQSLELSAELSTPCGVGLKPETCCASPLRTYLHDPVARGSALHAELARQQLAGQAVGDVLVSVGETAQAHRTNSMRLETNSHQ